MDGWQSGEGSLKGSASGGLNPGGDVRKEIDYGKLRRLQTYEVEVRGKAMSNEVLCRTRVGHGKVENVNRVDG